tara:strand:- start:26 stop:814 length:789 start_codon:yes stop_codon:yes gene_type:complete
MKSLSNGFFLVYDIEQLQSVIEFLQSKFGWDNNRSVKILNRLKVQSSSIPKAAIYCFEDEIKIANLIFHQTYIPRIDKNVVNLSAWYAINTHRGIDAIKFAKQLTIALDEYVITNYTPNAAAIKVFKALGYEDMHVKADSIGLQKKFPFIRLWLQDEYFSFTGNRSSSVDLTNDRQGVSINFSYKISSVKKMGIKLSTLSIYMESKKTHVPLLWLLKMVFCHGILRVNLFSKRKMASENSVWLIKNCYEELYISPRNSELSL